MSGAGSTVQGGQSIACEALQLGTGFEETFNHPNVPPFARDVQGGDIVLKRSKDIELLKGAWLKRKGEVD